MFQVRIHGRGGQGVVTAAELLSVAAFREGRLDDCKGCGLCAAECPSETIEMGPEEV